jgi:hypothetical protein
MASFFWLTLFICDCRARSCSKLNKSDFMIGVPRLDIVRDLFLSLHIKKVLPNIVCLHDRTLIDDLMISPLLFTDMTPSRDLEL